MRKLKKTVRALFALTVLVILSIIVGSFIGSELSYRVTPEYNYSPISYTTTTLVDPNFIEGKMYVAQGQDGSDLQVTKRLIINDLKIQTSFETIHTDPIDEVVFLGKLSKSELIERLQINLKNLFPNTQEKYQNLKIEDFSFDLPERTSLTSNTLNVGTVDVFMENCNFYNSLKLNYLLSLKDYEFSEISKFEDSLCEKYKVPDEPFPTSCTDCTYYPVDKKHPLSRDYAIEVINADGIPGGQKFSKAAYGHLLDLYSAAVAAGHNMRLTSAYRSYTDQEEVYEAWVQYEMGFGKSRAQAESDANTYSALPGFSEHQLGTTADISSLDCIGIETVCAANESFWLWLKDHAHEYGFVMSYPFGKDDLTGYIHEPWHYRFLGIGLATEYRTKYYGRSYPAEFLRNKKLY